MIYVEITYFNMLDNTILLNFVDHSATGVLCVCGYVFLWAIVLGKYNSVYLCNWLGGSSSLAQMQKQLIQSLDLMYS